MEDFLEGSRPLKGFGKIILKRRFVFVNTLFIWVYKPKAYLIKQFLQISISLRLLLNEETQRVFPLKK